MAISVDGYHAAPDRGLAWQTFGPEFTDYSVEQLDEVDTLVFGRTTYEELAAYWTTQAGANFDTRIADRMNRLSKLVVSESLTSVAWLESPIGVVSLGELEKIKARPGKDLAVLGSSTLTSALLGAGLIDELRFMVNPIVLGAGLKVFEQAGTVPLKRTRIREFSSGNVLICYTPA